MSRTKARNSSLHETISAYRLWYRSAPDAMRATCKFNILLCGRCDVSDSETGANLKVCQLLRVQSHCYSL